MEKSERKKNERKSLVQKPYFLPKIMLDALAAHRWLSSIEGAHRFLLDPVGNFAEDFLFEFFARPTHASRMLR